MNKQQVALDQYLCDSCDYQNINRPTPFDTSQHYSYRRMFIDIFYISLLECKYCFVQLVFPNWFLYINVLAQTYCVTIPCSFIVLGISKNTPLPCVPTTEPMNKKYRMYIELESPIDIPILKFQTTKGENLNSSKSINYPSIAKHFIQI